MTILPTPAPAAPEVEVHVGWLLPPMRLVVMPDEPRETVEALAAVDAEHRRLVDFRGPAATAAAVAAGGGRPAGPAVGVRREATGAGSNARGFRTRAMAVGTTT